MDGPVELESEFLRLITHELRTPLTGIRGYTDLLSSERVGPLNDTQRHMLAMIGFCAHRLDSLVEDLLILASIDAGVFGLAVEPVDLNALCATVVRSFGGRFRLGRVTLTVSGPPDLPTIHADPRQLERLLINLLNTAVAFSPEGGRVLIRTTRIDRGVRLTVADEGTGVSQDPPPGPSLAVVKAIVEHHGGTVSVASDPQTGTTVTVTLPEAPRPSERVRVIDRGRRHGG